MKTSMQYDLHGAARLDNVIRKNYGSCWKTNTPLRVYLGIAQLERKRGNGLCRQLVAGYHELAAASVVSLDSIGPALEALNGILCDIHKGSSIKSDKRATIRRLTIEELRYQHDLECTSEATGTLRTILPARKHRIWQGRSCPPRIACLALVLASTPEALGLVCKEVIR